MIQDLVDMLTGSNVVIRQNRQWQQANDNLAEAQATLKPLLDDTDWHPAKDGPQTAAQVAIAHALIGLLAERLSRR